MPELEFRQLGAGLRPELVGEALARRADRRERVGLAAAPVQRGGEEHPPSFPQRRLPNQPLRIGDGCRVLAEPEVSVDPHLFGAPSAPRRAAPPPRRRAPMTRGRRKVRLARARARARPRRRRVPGRRRGADGRMPRAARSAPRRRSRGRSAGCTRPAMSRSRRARSPSAPGRSTPAVASARCSGRSSPQRASASSSVVTGRPARSTSAESTARSLGLSVTPSRVSGPNTTTLMLRIVRRSAPPVNDTRIPRIPTAYPPRADAYLGRRSVEP